MSHSCCSNTERHKQQASSKPLEQSKFKRFPWRVVFSASPHVEFSSTQHTNIFKIKGSGFYWNLLPYLKISLHLNTEYKCYNSWLLYACLPDFFFFLNILIRGETFSAERILIILTLSKYLIKPLISCYRLQTTLSNNWAHLSCSFRRILYNN